MKELARHIMVDFLPMKEFAENPLILTEGQGIGGDQLTSIDDRVKAEIDRATDEAEASSFPEALDALEGVYADPPRMPLLWYREGVRRAVEKHERPSSWGTHDG